MHRLVLRDSTKTMFSLLSIIVHQHSETLLSNHPQADLGKVKELITDYQDYVYQLLLCLDDQIECETRLNQYQAKLARVLKKHPNKRSNKYLYHISELHEQHRRLHLKERDLCGVLSFLDTKRHKLNES